MTPHRNSIANSKALDRDEVVGTVLVDLSKAFDMIDHSKLLAKLYGYRVRGKELMWFEDYLRGRKQRVVACGKKAVWSSIERGVPQESILGPLLFIVFANDLLTVVKQCTVNLYADDTTLYCCCRDPQEVRRALEADMEAVAN